MTNTQTDGHRLSHEREAMLERLTDLQTDAWEMCNNTPQLTDRIAAGELYCALAELAERFATDPR